MADSFQRIERRSWGSRLRASIGGVVAGLALLLAGVVLLFWGEGRAVQRAKTLKEGAASVQTVVSDRVDPAFEGRLVHLSGIATSSDGVEDPRFGVQAIALKLSRSVEMYQWVERSKSEERTKLGGGTETVTTYSYDQEWSSRPIDSSDFQKPEGHRNPAFPVDSQEWVVPVIDLGAFELDSVFVSKLDRQTPVELRSAVAERAASELGRRVVVADGALYAGDSPSSPRLGDLRIRFSMVEPAEVSIVGAQRGQLLEAYQAKAGGRIALLRYGKAESAEMFQAAQSQNRMLTWILRFGGFFVLFLGFQLILRPARVFADVLPIAGRLVGAGIGFVSLALAFLLGFVVMAVGWFFYRPLLSIAFLVLAGVCVVLLVRRARKSKVVLPPLPVPKASL